MPRVVSSLVLAFAVASCGNDTAPEGPIAALAVNEIAGTGQDFVELFNTGTTPVDLGGYTVTDSSGGAARTTGVARFAAGTNVAPGGYALVMFESNCPSTLMGVPCIRQESGISQGDGETLYIIDAMNRTVRMFAYPANGGPAGRSYGRIPNGSGPYQSTVRTPGAANAS